MFQSPLKTVTEKIKPTQSKSGISSLRFNRASDFKKFIGFIKTETEELEKIKLPTIAEVKPKSKSGGLLGLLGLGLLGGLGALFGGDGGKNNERTGSEGGTASQFNNELLLTKNIRKVQKNFGGSKFFKGDKGLKKTFKKTFKKPSKSEIEDLKLKKGVRKTIRENKIKELLKEKKLLEDQKRFTKKFQLGDDRDMKILKEEIKVVNDDIKELVKQSKLDDDIFKIISKGDKGNFKSRVNVLRELIKESKVSFDRRGNVKFAPQSDLASRLSIEDIINSSPQGKDLIKKIARMDPLLFDVPEGGTLFSKILGKDRGIKIENRMGIIRESLDDMFTGIGKKTKPIRKFFSPVAKTIGNTKTVKGALQLGRNIAKPVDIGLTAIIAPFQLNILENRGGLFNPNIGLDRTNIVTHVYDMFTHFYNAGVEGLGFDDAHKRLKISKPIDRNEKFFNYFTQKTEVINQRRITDAYNEEILEAREAKKLRDAINMNSNFNTSMLNNSSMQLPKSTPFSVQKVDGGEFNPPFDYSDMGTIDFSSAAILYKLNK